MNPDLAITRQQIGESAPADRAADAAYFEELVRRHYQRAYLVAYRLSGSHTDADDLTQEALVRAFESLHRYQRDLPFINWLYRIMVNLHIDEVRRRKRVRVESVEELPTSAELVDQESDPAELVLSRELDERIQTALQSLPEEFRIAVTLCDVEGFSYEEIAEIMRCAIGTVRSRVHRGRKQMRDRLEGQRRSGSESL
jgi:RNA polymerase sigma-70 factor (ECF subfamily)